MRNVLWNGKKGFFCSLFPPGMSKEKENENENQKKENGIRFLVNVEYIRRHRWSDQVRQRKKNKEICVVE
jgi:hypothetical protein